MITHKRGVYPVVIDDIHKAEKNVDKKWYAEQETKRKKEEDRQKRQSWN